MQFMETNKQENATEAKWKPYGQEVDTGSASPFVELDNGPSRFSTDRPYRLTFTWNPHTTSGSSSRGFECFLGLWNHVLAPKHVDKVATTKSGWRPGQKKVAQIAFVLLEYRISFAKTAAGWWSDHDMGVQVLFTARGFSLASCNETTT